MTLPTFVVIGAMKAGTVSLGHHLDEHPHVFRARGEPNFFVAENNWPRGRGWYESLFDGAGRAAAIGECSPSYTWAHVFRGVPERMARVVPEARLVYVVRDPIARMQSMYMHQVSAGRERRRPEVALLDDRYLGPSRYGFQPAAFLDHRSIDKPVPRLHDLGWLPRRQVKLNPRWRPGPASGGGTGRGSPWAYIAHPAVVAADDSDRVRRRRPDGHAYVRSAGQGRP